MKELKELIQQNSNVEDLMVNQFLEIEEKFNKQNQYIEDISLKRQV
jgi:hypothetical protein